MAEVMAAAAWEVVGTGAAVMEGGRLARLMGAVDMAEAVTEAAESVVEAKAVVEQAAAEMVVGVTAGAVMAEVAGAAEAMAAEAVVAVGVALEVEVRKGPNCHQTACPRRQMAQEMAS